MAIIVIEPPDEARVRAAVKILHDAGMKARKLTRPLSNGFVNVSHEETEAAVVLLGASSIQATVRPD
jgi:hypothetical protein